MAQALKAFSSVQHTKAFVMAMRTLTVVALLASAGAMDLTKETWDGAVAGKSVFVKFQAPW